jgi:hypothetical protein
MIRITRLLVAALAAVTTAAVGAGPLAPPAAAAPAGGQLVAQLRAGTLLATHGTRPLCTGALRCDAQVVTAARGSARPLSTGTPAGYGPADPARAGLYARAGRLPLVLGPNTVYRAPSRALHDVTAGGNDEGNGGTCPTYALCNAGPGWDGPTGVGTPRGLTAF